MITTDYWRLSHPDAPMAANYGPLARCEEWRNRRPILGREPSSYNLDRYPCCRCCGEPLLIETWADAPPYPNTWRCPKHVGRNPCAIEGCGRTTAAPASGRLEDDSYLCPEHWRRLVPPRSRVRRAYHALRRRAKRQGWTPRLTAQFWRFWDTLIRQARRRATDGYIDQAAI